MAHHLMEDSAPGASPPRPELGKAGGVPDLPGTPRSGDEEGSGGEAPASGAASAHNVGTTPPARQTLPPIKRPPGSDVGAVPSHTDPRRLAPIEVPGGGGGGGGVAAGAYDLGPRPLVPVERRSERIKLLDAGSLHPPADADAQGAKPSGEDEGGGKSDDITEIMRVRRMKTERLLTEVAQDVTSHELREPGEETVSAPPGYIAPDNRWKQAWDWGLLILVMYSSIFIPLNIAFFNEPLSSTFDVVVDILFGVDLLLNFRTGTEDSWGRLVYDPKVIALHYLKTWFLIDLIAVIPFEAFAGLLGLISSSNDAVGAADNFSTLSLLKVPRLLRIGRLMKKFNQFAAANAFRIVSLLVLFSLVAHWMACAWFKIGLTWIDHEQGVWVLDQWSLTPEEIVYSLSAGEKYTVSMYWALTTLTTVGYGDITPENDNERIFATFMFVVGAVIYASIFANVTSLISKFDEAATRYKDKVLAISEFFALHSHMPEKLLKRTLEYVDAQWNIEKGIDINDVLEELPDWVRSDIKFELHGTSMLKMPFFRECGESFLRALVDKLDSQVCLAGDEIVRSGDLATHMYFLHRGRVDVMDVDNRSVALQLGPGSFFGEAALLRKNAAGQRRAASVRAKTFCYLFALSAAEFDEVLAHFPEARRHIADMSRKRQEVAATRTRVRKLQREQTRRRFVAAGTTGKAAVRFKRGLGGRHKRDTLSEEEEEEAEELTTEQRIKKHGSLEDVAALVLQALWRFRLKERHIRRAEGRDMSFAERTAHKLTVSSILHVLRVRTAEAAVQRRMAGMSDQKDSSRSLLSGASTVASFGTGPLGEPGTPNGEAVVNAVKEQADRISELETQHEQMEATLDEILERLSAMK